MPIRSPVSLTSVAGELSHDLLPRVLLIGDCKLLELRPSGCARFQKFLDSEYDRTDSAASAFR